jgi:hypothetical protein
MPKITVEIQWDEPEDPHWLNAENIAIALDAYCSSSTTAIVVRPLAPVSTGGDPPEFVDWLCKIMVGIEANGIEVNFASLDEDGSTTEIPNVRQAAEQFAHQIVEALYNCDAEGTK